MVKKSSIFARSAKILGKIRFFLVDLVDFEGIGSGGPPYCSKIRVVGWLVSPLLPKMGGRLVGPYPSGPKTGGGG